jgi:ABC-type phosphate transport system substrate-binding protein
MKLRAAAVTAMLLVAGCDAPAEPGTPIACAAGSAAGQGSSAQTNAVNAWIKAYQIACPDASIEYSSVGSGAGVRAFLAGTGDFAGTDTPLTGADKQRADARCGTGPAVHLPLVIGPIALAHNVAGIEDLQLSPPTIARIFSGKITVWNDRAITDDNPGTALPATRIRIVHRSDGSGTTDNFLRYLSGVAVTGSPRRSPAPAARSGTSNPPTPGSPTWPPSGSAPPTAVSPARPTTPRPGRSKRPESPTTSAWRSTTRPRPAAPTRSSRSPTNCCAAARSRRRRGASSCTPRARPASVPPSRPDTHRFRAPSVSG